MLRIHETNKNPKTEICEYCAKTFKSRKELLSHIRSMHMENSIRREKVQCQICDAWLSNRYTLKEHMVRHNSGPQKCNQCDKISPNQHALCTFFIHILIVSSQRFGIVNRNASFQCAMFGKSIVIAFSDVICVRKPSRQLLH